MKKALLVFGAIALMVFASSVAWAIPSPVPTINISDLTESQPAVSYSGWPLLNTLTPTTVSSENESVVLAGYLINNFITVGTLGSAYGSVMKETDGSVSDFLTLAVSPVISYDTGTVLGKINVQPFVLSFMSDGADEFDIALRAFNLAFSNPYSVTETGAYQSMFPDLSSNLVVNARSDVDVAPIPGSLLLLGSGIVGMMGIGIRRKSS